MNRTQTAILWLGLLLVALSIRVGAAVFWQSRMVSGQRFKMGDSVTYWELGRALAEDRPYEYGTPPRRVLRTPAYPLLIAAVFRMAGGETSALTVRLVGAVLGSLTVAGVGWLTYLVYGRLASLIACVLACFYPGAVSSSVLILSESLFCPLLVGQIGLTVLALRNPSRYGSMVLAFLSGITCGVAILSRPSWLLFTPFAWLLCCLVAKRKYRCWAMTASALLGLVLLMVPWCLRNARIVGQPVLTTLQVGASLYDGWNPQADGASNMYFVDSSADRVWQPLRESEHEQTWEIAWDQQLRSVACRWAMENPVTVVKLAIIKLFRMWSPWPHEESLRGGWISLICTLGFVAILLPALRQAVRTEWQDNFWIWLILPAAYFTALHMIFVSSIRYRQPSMLLLIVLAAEAYAHWYSKCKMRERISNHLREVY